MRRGREFAKCGDDSRAALPHRRDGRIPVQKAGWRRVRVYKNPRSNSALGDSVQPGSIDYVAHGASGVEEQGWNRGSFRLPMGQDGTQGDDAGTAGYQQQRACPFPVSR